MWLIKSRATSSVTLPKGSQKSFKSNHWHYWHKNSNKAQTVADRVTQLRVDQAQDKFPGCISLVSISFVKQTSSFLRFTDFLLVAHSVKFKSKSLGKISNWELSRWPKVTKHRAMQLISFTFLAIIKLQTRKFNISEGEWSLSWFEKSEF